MLVDDENHLAGRATRRKQHEKAKRASTLASFGWITSADWWGRGRWSSRGSKLAAMARSVAKRRRSSRRSAGDVERDQQYQVESEDPRRRHRDANCLGEPDFCSDGRADRQEDRGESEREQRTTETARGRFSGRSAPEARRRWTEWR